MSEPSEQEIARVAAALKEDIAWTVRNGPGWDPMRIAPVVRGSFATGGGGTGCGGLCAIGAHVVRHALSVPDRDGLGEFGCNVKAAARSLQVDESWLSDVCGYVGNDDDDLDEEEQTVDGCDLDHPSAWTLSRELRRFGHDATRAFNDAKVSP